MFSYFGNLFPGSSSSANNNGNNVQPRRTSQQGNQHAAVATGFAPSSDGSPPYNVVVISSRGPPPPVEVRLRRAGRWETLEVDSQQSQHRYDSAGYFNNPYSNNPYSERLQQLPMDTPRQRTTSSRRPLPPPPAAASLTPSHPRTVQFAPLDGDEWSTNGTGTHKRVLANALDGSQRERDVPHVRRAGKRLASEDISSAVKKRARKAAEENSMPVATGIRKSTRAVKGRNAAPRELRRR